jgi:hypothetical protein
LASIASARSPSSATVDLEPEIAQLLGQDQPHAFVVVDHQHRADPRSDLLDALRSRPSLSPARVVGRIISTSVPWPARS